MDKKKVRLLLSVIFSLAAAICAVVGAVLHFTKKGFWIFEYYTVDSNVFLAVAAVIYCADAIPVLAGKRSEIRGGFRALKYFATVTVAVTMLVVIFMLAPMFDSYVEGLKELLFGGHLIYHHLLCPVFSILSFLLFDPPLGKRGRLVFLSLIPTFLYAAISTLMNLLRVWYGPYPFLRVYEQSLIESVLWFFAIHAFALLIGAGIYFGQRAFGRKKIAPGAR